MVIATSALLVSVVLAACSTTGGARPSSTVAEQSASPVVASTESEGQSVAGNQPVDDSTAAVDSIDTQATATAPEADADADIANGLQGSMVAADGLAVDAGATQVPTQEELDYAALYGEPPYDPVADPTLPEAAKLPISYDPWEPLNRRIHTFNNAVDRTIALPLAKAYVAVTPQPLRLGVSNFFNNLGQPANALNSLLQGRPKEAAQSLARFVLNSTLGIGGLFDPASDANLPYRYEDFGQTLGVWGWKNSRYVELPLFGPRTIRDTLGIFGDAPLSPIRPIEEDSTRVFLQGLQLVDVRTQLFAVDAMRAGSTDDYQLVRNAWVQRRNYQIFGDMKKSDEDSLPDYLREDDDNPTVPADVMPIIPGIPSR